MKILPRLPCGVGTTLLTLLTGLGLPFHLGAQVDFDQIQVQPQEVRGGIFLLGNAGGNIALSLGEDGVFMVDAGYEEMAEKVLAAAALLAREEGANPRLGFVANTHWHFDHTGGNALMAASGATILGHEGAARLMAQDRVLAALDREVPATPPAGRPLLTFNDRVNVQWNGDLLHLVHMPLAHSDGDIIVHFRDADIVHLGDLFFNGMYPYIDVDFGGNLRGMVRALQEILDHTNEDTLFIPGHGPLADRSDLLSYRDMLEGILERVQTLVDRGLTREEVVAAKPSVDFDGQWVRNPGSEEADFFVGLVYDGMVRGASGR